MLTRRRHGDEGIVAVNLAIVLAFALFAVVQLTRTTVAAGQIDTRVMRIVGDVEPIDKNLDYVPKLDQTDQLAKEILASATPLSAQADQIIAAAGSIDDTVSSIESRAGSINGTVKGINANFTALAPVVRSINDNVAAINGRVDRIILNVAGIKADLNNILGEVGTSRGTITSKTIRGHANSIDCTANTGGGACER